MNRREGTCTSHSSATLFYRSWLPDQAAPKAMLAIVHGFGEHTDLYEHLGEFFVAAGYGVIALDLRGHGRSSGARGFIRHWQDYRDDVATLIALARRIGPALPIFLVGHSMGGLLAIDYATMHPEGLRGIVAMGPAIGKIGVSRFLVWLSRFLSRIWPSFSLDTRLQSAAMSRDPVAVARLEADPLVHGRGTARLGTEVFEAIDRVQRGAELLRIPILIQHGEADTVAHPDGSRAFFDRMTFPDREFLTYPGGFHNLFVDLNWKEVLTDIEQWVGRHV
ncbi:MAG: lysophospholipase [Gemmatimonadota bacterium]